MKMQTLFKKCAVLLFFVIPVFLSGCKVAAYHDLKENEANQMLALLLSNDIQASKQVAEKGDSATLMVEESELVKALGILHSNGFPKRQFATVNEIFPPGQLITSPEQQQIKLVYAQEQQLDAMLSQIPGVISSNVQLNESTDTDVSSLDSEKTPPTASVLLVYSKGRNVNDYLVQVRSLIRNSVPNLTDDNISVVMMPSDSLAVKHKGNPKVSQSLLSAMGVKAGAGSQQSSAGGWHGLLPILFIVTFILFVLCAGTLLWLWARKNILSGKKGKVVPQVVESSSE